MRRALVVVSIVAALCLVTGAAPATAHACAGADGRAGSTSRAQLASALTCLIDQHRRASGLSGVHRNARLRRAAKRHARDMLTHDFFGHTSTNGADVGDRARSAGYPRGARRWGVGEALHWGEGSRSTPREALHELLNSPQHHAILMSRRFDDIGVAAVSYRRGNGRRAATYVVDMGHRS